jgi:hypothetical protein
MIAEYDQKSLKLGIPGLLLQIASILIINFYASKRKAGQAIPPDWLGYLLLAGKVLGSVMLIIGLCYYAKAKGYSAVLGLLGLLSCIGLFVLAVLPDRAKQAANK